MPHAHSYPDLTAGPANFMFGSFDPDDMASDSAVSFGEALLRVTRNNQPIAGRRCVHRHAGAAGATDGAFMFGPLTRQLDPVAPDEEILNLWATELA